MVKPYDIAIKKLIQVFANNIPVYGLQNEDTDMDSLVSQAAEGDEIPFPLISVFRNPEIEITDAPQSKKASVAEGYPYRPEPFDLRDPKMANLIVMGAKLKYTIDVFDVTKASAEEIALRLFFRLRNNPEIRATFNFKDFDHTEVAIADLAMDGQVTNVRLQDNSKAQAYQIRLTFTLNNANIYDLVLKTVPVNLEYEVNVKMKEK